MTKAEFLLALKQGLSGIPQNELNERIAFYNEIIDDRIEDGLSEEEAVADAGEVDGIISQVLSEIPLSKLIKEKVKPKRKMQAWEIVLLIIGAPIWFPLLLSAAVIILSLYVSLWSVIISLWAVVVSFAACFIGFAAYGTISIVLNNVLSGLFFIGAAIICAGVFLLSLVGCKYISTGTVMLTKKLLLKLKSCFIKREVAK